MLFVLPKRDLECGQGLTIDVFSSYYTTENDCLTPLSL